MNKIEIIADFKDYSIIEKPIGITTTPGNTPNSLVEQYREIFPGIITTPAVHRLDRETSGLLICAKNLRTYSYFSEEFREKRVQKEYIALIDGVVTEDRGIITLPLAKDPSNPIKQVVSKKGKESITEWFVLKRYTQYTLVKFIPHTGRTHQLRVHSSSKLGLGYPIVGDYFYGTSSDRLYLQAHKITFIDPATLHHISFISNKMFILPKN